MSKARESAIVGSERFIIRPAADDDIKEMSGVLQRARAQLLPAGDP